jgi:pyruvate/2-oxoglutarate dehydrogenase complex dihydrolipoamide dehydrogenase (E3) component
MALSVPPETRHSLQVDEEVRRDKATEFWNKHGGKLVALGAEPVVPKIPGADRKNVFDILSVYSNKSSLGKNVAIIGAGVFGTETGICLAKDGHKVTVITSEKQMIPEEAIGPHNMENQIDIYKHHKNFSYFLEATATEISEGKVLFRDTAGVEKSVQADSVVVYAGLKPKMDEAMRLSHERTKTAVIVAALEAFVRQQRIRGLKRFKGKVSLDIDLAALRDRR